MTTKIATIFIIFCLAAGYPVWAGEETIGKGNPVITQSFAPKEVRPGDVWKVYLKSSNPNGDMRYIVSILYQPGWGDYPVSRILIPEEHSKELDGYINLNTCQGLIPMGNGFLNSSAFKLRVQIQDRAGHFSEPTEFFFSFSPRANLEEPPSGVFRERDLGPIRVNLHPSDVGC